MDIFINESNGHTYLNGLITEADVRNGNGRLYPYPIAKPAIFEMIQRIDNGEEIWSEREHPQRLEMDASLACGKIVEVKWNDLKKNARCRVEVIDTTPAGRKLLEDIKNNVKVGISTRGSGRMNDDKIIEAIKFITADIVSIPSCQNCWLSESTGELIPDDFIFEYDKKIITEMRLKDLALLSTLERLQK